MSKGSMLDLTLVIVLALVIGLVSIFGYMVWSEFVDAMPSDIRYDEVNQTIDNVTTVLSGFDYLFVFLISGLCFAVIIGAFMVKSHPIFFIFVWFILGIEILLSVMISNVFSDIITESVIVGYASQFTYTVMFIQNLPVFILGMGAVIALVMFSKGDKGGPV